MLKQIILIVMTSMVISACSGKQEHNKQAVVQVTPPQATPAESQPPVNVAIATTQSIIKNSNAWAAKNNIDLSMDYKVFHYYQAERYVEATETLKAAAKGGDAVAQTILGVCYIETCGNLERNWYLGGLWLLRGAEQGLPIAQYYLLQYANDKDMPEKFKHGSWVINATQKGAGLLGSIAASGSNVAKQGTQYVKAVGVPTDNDLAEAPTDVSSEAPAESTADKPAASTDAVMPPLLASDFLSTSKAAEAGDPQKQYELSRYYLQGIATPQNYILAAKWLILSKAGTNNSSPINQKVSASLARIEGMMTSQQIADAQSQASAWYQAHHP